MLGTADLPLGIAIIAGRSSPQRWRTVAARSLLHLVFAREYMRNSRKRHAVVLRALFTIDAGIAYTAWRSQLRPSTPPCRLPHPTAVSRGRCGKLAR